jgi:hypothetical protein
MIPTSEKLRFRSKTKQSVALALGLLGLAVDPAAALQDALRIVTSDADTCASVCLDRGKIFCGRTDF